MATLADRFKAFMNPIPSGEIASRPLAMTTPAPVVTEGDGYAKFAVERTRAGVIKECRGMYKNDPRVEKMHRMYARDLVRGGFVVRSDNEAATQVVVDLQQRINLNQALEDWLRLSQRDGDTFLEVTVAGDKIGNVTRKPTLKMHRNSNAADMFDDPARAFWMGSDDYMSTEVPADAIWFAEWQMIHARWNHDEESRYGTPMMQSARQQYKYVVDGELNVAVRRKIGGAQIRQHIVEGNAADVEKYKEQNKSAFGKLAAVVDLFSNKPGSLNVVQGDGNIDRIADVQHHIATMFTASDVPMELIAYGGDLNRDILGEKKAEYEETLNQGREWATTEIIKPLIEREWLLHGILPQTVKYKILWRKATMLDPQQLTSLADAAMKLRILGIPDEQIKIILAVYLRDVDVEILNGDGFNPEQFAQSLKGLSI